MLDKILGFRVNFLIVFGGALTVIVLFKIMTVMLPPKYYFSFSALFGGRDQPFLVESFSVMGSRLCQIMTRYNLTEEDLEWRGLTLCRNQLERSGLTPERVDEVYGIALRSDKAVPEAMRASIAKDPVRPLTDTELERILEKSRNNATPFVEMFDAYLPRFRVSVGAVSHESIKSLYGDILSESGTDLYPESEEKRTPVKLPEQTRRQIIEAHKAIAAELNQTNWAERIPAMRKSAVDAILKQAPDGSRLADGIMRYYREGLVQSFHGVMVREFSQRGLPAGRDAERRLVLDAVFPWRDYVLSILIRLTPVFLFGLVAGVLVGRTEIASIGLAGGLAAFLLSWPLILLWDNLVSVTWQSMWPQFYGLYALYVASFYIAARTAGLLGAWLREHEVIRLAAQPAKASARRTTWRELGLNILVAVALNGAVYASNMWLASNNLWPTLTLTEHR